MKTSKWILLTLMMAVIVFVSACGQNNGANNKQALGGNEGKVTLKFWYPGHETYVVDAVNKLIADFEQENPDIKIEYSAIPWKEFFQKLSVSYAGGIAPDIHGLGHGQLVSTVDQDQYMDLNRFIKEHQWDGEQDIIPSSLQSGQWNGGQYGLIMPAARPLFWRKDFFQEAGLDPNTPPRTLDELFEFANKVKVVENGKTVRSGIDIQTSNGEQSYFSLLLLLGQEIYDKDGNPLFDSPESIELLTKLVELYNDGAIMAANQQQLNGLPFTNGLAAMSFLNTMDLNTLKDTVGLDKLGYALPPKGPTGKQTSLMLGNFISMSKSTKHPEEAWRFIEFMFSKEQMLEFSQATGLLPTRQSLKEEFVKISPENELLFEAMNDSASYIPSPAWNANIKYLRLALEEAFNGIKSAEEALKSNAAKAREELKDL
ncbi:hypothetical protein PAE9249_03809 [Paenibacillus sp. CECT 9249]|uniref:ABC transporter substrate-binding protein n=1 Tax=Paenibacillus sp. CECT 9249 TaxID=2845385 RepID=UPI001E348A18|nr:ABC transporter substrate-binding protein [Paenibacillus sp. CECT 9249]CAH0121282.1 hypothetical protein PAE9249_03809 [Paenibacillus sp. CECT 9249]